MVGGNGLRSTSVAGSSSGSYLLGQGTGVSSNMFMLGPFWKVSWRSSMNILGSRRVIFQSPIRVCEVPTIRMDWSGELALL